MKELAGSIKHTAEIKSQAHNSKFWQSLCHIGLNVLGLINYHFPPTFSIVEASIQELLSPLRIGLRILPLKKFLVLSLLIRLIVLGIRMKHKLIIVSKG